MLCINLNVKSLEPQNPNVTKRRTLKSSNILFFSNDDKSALQGEKKKIFKSYELKEKQTTKKGKL